MVNDKTHLYGPEDASKDRKNTEKRRDQQQFSRFSVAVSSALNTAGLEPKAPATQIDTKVQIGDPYDDTKGSVATTPQTVSFDVYGSNYTFYEVTTDVDFLFDELPTGRHITFTLDILVNQVAGVTITFSTVTNPPVLAGNDGDRYVLEFIVVNRTDPTGVNPPVQTITFISGATAGGVSFPLTPDIKVHGNVTGAVDIDLSAITAHYQEMTLIGDITLTFSNPPADDKEISFIIDITQDATGGRTVGWPPSVRVDPVVGSGVNARTVIIVTTVDNGVNYDALIVTGGEVDAANKTLSNLTSPTSINQDLLFSTTGFDLGNSINPLDNLFVNQVRLQNGTLITNVPNIVSEDGNQMTFNVDTAQIFLWKIASITKMTVAASSLNLNNVMNLDNAAGMTFFNAGFDPVADGEFRLNGTDMKVFSGGVVRNFSDITPGGGGANQQLSNLSGTVAVNLNLLPNQSTGGSLGSGVSTEEWFNLYVQKVRFPVKSTLAVGSNVIQTVNNAGNDDMVFNVSDTSLDRFLWTMNGVTQLSLTATELIANGVNFNLNANDILAVNNIGTSGDPVNDFFVERMRFPTNIAPIANAHSISVEAVTPDTMMLNVPTGENWQVTENGAQALATNLLLVDTSANTFTIGAGLLATRFQGSATINFAITHPATSGSAVDFTTGGSGYTFDKKITCDGDILAANDTIETLGDAIHRWGAIYTIVCRLPTTTSDSTTRILSNAGGIEYHALNADTHAWFINNTILFSISKSGTIDTVLGFNRTGQSILADVNGIRIDVASGEGFDVIIGGTGTVFFVDANGIDIITFTDATRPTPAAAGAGHVIFNSDDGGLNVSDGTNWRAPSGGWVNT